MPAQETTGRNQTAVWWRNTGDDAYGQPQIDEDNPVELDVRWEYKRRDLLDKNGTRITVEAEVRVDRDIEIGSQMWLGELDDWRGTGTGSGGETDEVMVVVAFESIPDVKGREFARTVWLRFARDVVG